MDPELGIELAKHPYLVLVVVAAALLLAQKLGWAAIKLVWPRIDSTNSVTREELARELAKGTKEFSLIRETLVVILFAQSKLCEDCPETKQKIDEQLARLATNKLARNGGT